MKIFFIFEEDGVHTPLSVHKRVRYPAREILVLSSSVKFFRLRKFLAKNFSDVPLTFVSPYGHPAIFIIGLLSRKQAPMLKTLLIASLFMWAQTPSCGPSQPVPLRVATSLPPITCDKPYTGQLLLGGKGPYTTTFNNPTFTNILSHTDFLPTGLGMSVPGGGVVIPRLDPSTPGQSSPFVTTGYLIGTVPCSALPPPSANNQTGSVLIAGIPVRLERK